MRKRSHRGEKGSNDKLESNRQPEAIPEYIDSEETSPLGIQTKAVAGGLHHHGYEFEEADTDRFDITIDGQLVTPSPDPTSITFELHNISSEGAMCFFCKGVRCDQVFMARSVAYEKTKAYGVHTQCVLDHDAMQALAKQGTGLS